MKKCKIILVENDEDELEFMRHGFDETGLFDVLAELHNGDALFNWLDTNPQTMPDLILSDLNMPGKNGYDVLSEIRDDKRYTHIPVIITSTSSTKSLMDKCFALGAADYLVKPDTFVQYVPYVVNLHKVILDKQLVDL